ncbi:MAG: Tim44 domain-containing protein [Proteobacteria bacterium]|nr:Tim44 domain-containing protein [Pseudomonadota bacterium]
MSEGIPYADIVILALVAGFILLRLRSVLGDKTGNDNPSYFQKPTTPPPERQQAIVQVEDKAKAKPRGEPDAFVAKIKNPAVVESINAIKARDMDFMASHFVEGAKGAFEMVFDAFAKGDRDTLRFLLAPNVYDEFAQALEGREAQALKPETTLVSVTAKDITSAELSGNMARLSVKFSSEQVSVMRDESGKIVEGDPSELHVVEDEWTFERDVTSKSPNWKVIET